MPPLPHEAKTTAADANTPGESEAVAIGSLIPTSQPSTLTVSEPSSPISPQGLSRAEKIARAKEKARAERLARQRSASDAGTPEPSTPPGGRSPDGAPARFPPTTAIAKEIVQQVSAGGEDLFKQAVSVANRSGALCRAALKLAASGESGADRIEQALLTAAEVTAFGVSVVAQAADSAQHPTVRSALNKKHDVMQGDSEQLEQAMASFTQEKHDAWDAMGTPNQVRAFEDLEIEDTPR